MHELYTIYAVSMALFAILGAVLGAQKGRGGLGFVLGLLLGVFGLVIIALTSAGPKATKPAPAPNALPSGWYIDPLLGDRHHYWDGIQWTADLAENGRAFQNPTCAGQLEAGWYHDPLARHQVRYWDGTQWTANVAENGIHTTDPFGAVPTPPTFTT